MFVTSFLCLSLQRIRQFTRGLAKADSLKSRGLLLAHQGSFLAAAVITVSAFILGIYKTDDLKRTDPELSTKILIAGTYLSVGGYIAWFVVHCLMLRIFVKYGKPLEDDERTLIENKLTEMFTESQDVHL